jgi:histidinol phosphatase-like enzyme (inositol monophosphatase family)
MDEDLIDLAAFAEQLAAAAREVTLTHDAASGDVINKAGAGFDPVTAADRQAEQIMRSLIAKSYPDHGVDGEEFEAVSGRGQWRWSLDPIDGTRAFICGLPSWTTLIALLRDERPVVGVIDAPRLDELYLGAGSASVQVAAGRRTPIRTSGCSELSAARLATTDPFLFAGSEWSAFDRVRRAVRVARYGLDAYAYARLAAGSLDLVVESGLKPHDYHALVPVVTGAGGVIGDWFGGDDLSRGRVLAAASQPLFDAASALLLAADQTI